VRCSLNVQQILTYWTGSSFPCCCNVNTKSDSEMRMSDSRTRIPNFSLPHGTPRAIASKARFRWTEIGVGGMVPAEIRRNAQSIASGHIHYLSPGVYNSRAFSSAIWWCVVNLVQGSPPQESKLSPWDGHQRMARAVQVEHTYHTRCRVCFFFLSLPPTLSHHSQQ